MSMNTRDFLTAVASNQVTDEITAKAAELLAALDAKNAKRRTTETKEKKEAAARRDLVLNFLKTHEGAFTRDDIAAETGLTPTAVTGACTKLVEGGKVEKTSTKVDKKSKVAYCLA